MISSPDTQSKILRAALNAFLARGIKRTSVEEVAADAGMTRVTVYRYFSDKEALVRAAFMQIVVVLQAVCREMGESPGASPDFYLDRIVGKLAELGRGDLPAGLSELKRLYPHIAAEFHAARLAAIGQIFDVLLAQARQRGILRQELNLAVMQAYFASAVVNVLEDPELVALGLPPAEIFATVKTIFLHGILNREA